MSIIPEIRRRLIAMNRTQSLRAIADALGVPHSNIDHLIRKRISPRLELVEKVAAGMGLRVVLSGEQMGSKVDQPGSDSVTQHEVHDRKKQGKSPRIKVVHP